jgi:hypothetical protein
MTSVCVDNVTYQHSEVLKLLNSKTHRDETGFNNAEQLLYKISVVNMTYFHCLVYCMQTISPKY